MKRCLSEPALLRVYMRDASTEERQHAQLCAACAERFDKLGEDLGALRRILEAPPPRTVAERVNLFPIAWVPAAAAALTLVAVLLSVPWLRQPAGTSVPPGARGTAVAAFAADVSEAMFADSAPTLTVALATNDASYLQAALDAGSPCTRDDYLNGDCDDQLSALLFESE